MTLLEFDGSDEVMIAWQNGLKPDANLSVSEWADENRVLSSKGSAEPGPYRTARTPYLRKIMDSLSVKSAAKKVVFPKAAQIGATEAGNNWIGYCIEQSPAPMMTVQPTVDLAKRFSNQRLGPLIDESPSIRERVQPSKSRSGGNTILEKSFPGGLLVLTGANSAVGLRSMSARFLFFDEVDGYPVDVEGEGDPVRLAEVRANSFGHRKKIFMASTPTIAGISRIQKEWELSDQQRYFCPCPECGAMQYLQFQQLKWTWGDPDSVVYECEHCEFHIEERHKTWMMDEGNGAEWIPTAPAETLEAAAAAGTVGFHINALYSPLGWYSWADIARQWESAQGKETELKTFKNTVLGEVWQEKGEAPDWERLYERRSMTPLGIVPKGGLVLTAGADVQRAGRVEVDVWAWGREGRSWLVDHIVFEGQISDQAVWDEMTHLLDRTWPCEAGAEGRDQPIEMRLARLAIDSGDGMTTNDVYSWVRSAGSGQVIAIKGRAGYNRAAPVDGPSYVDVTENGKKVRRGVQLWNISVEVFKSETYRFLRLTAPTDEERAEGKTHPPGFISFPSGLMAEWFKQLTAEQLMSTKTSKGYMKREWKQIRDRNEALDCRVYARAAAWLMGMERWSERQWVELESQFDPTSTDDRPAGEPNRHRPLSERAKRRPGALGGRKKDWF